jgi:hypothetical protein
MLKFSAKLPRSVRYDNERVWKTGDWFAAPLYPGQRILFVLRVSDTPFPAAVNSDREMWNPSGQLREALTAYANGIREENGHNRKALRKHDIVLDGVLGLEGYGTHHVEFPKSIRETPARGHFVLYTDDVYSYKVMMAGEGSHTFLRRRKRLRNIVGEVDCHRLRLTQYTRITTQKQFETIRENCCAYRGFGVILRRDTPYEAGKTGNILRVPPLEDDK